MLFTQIHQLPTRLLAIPENANHGDLAQEFVEYATDLGRYAGAKSTSEPRRRAEIHTSAQKERSCNLSAECALRQPASFFIPCHFWIARERSTQTAQSLLARNRISSRYVFATDHRGSNI